jgi:diguanylate cyclase (GGDEF)-like protein
LQLRHEQEGLSKPARVLLVQDDPRAAMMIGEMLRTVWSRGLVVSQTERTLDAAQELLDHGATCVLLDLPRREAPGDALQHLTAAAPHTPIIVLSDQPEEDFGVAAVRAGAQDFLLKSELTAAVLGRSVRYAVERKRAEAALALQALHDPLTALPNRALFLDRLRVALDRSRRTAAPVVVMFLDVDGFKQINDTLGHSAGDILLTVLAERFGGLMRPMDTVARFGGDEFTFLFEGLEGEEEAALVAERISQAAGRPLTLGDRPMSISVSTGLTVVSDPGTAIEDVIGHADSAMYRAKQLGGARFEVFGGASPVARGPAAHGDLTAALAEALDRSELRVHYQPRVSLNGDTGLVGFEALVRWEHPELGLIEPGEFIPLAEETGLIGPIGDWVLEQALDHIHRWRASRPEVTISVNLSPSQVHDAGLPARLATAIARTGNDPSVLILEVPEAALAAEPELITMRLAALDETGVTLAIDDFGTGHASHSELRALPMGMLKLDRTLVSRLGSQAGEDIASVGEAVALGHTLGLIVVAEGVETDVELAVLRDLGCDGAQGFLFSQPVPEDGVSRLLGRN